MFSKRSQYPNYKIRGKSGYFHYPYYGLYNLSYCLYIWLRDFISRYLFITSTERFSGVVSKEQMRAASRWKQSTASQIQISRQ